MGVALLVHEALKFFPCPRSAKWRKDPSSLVYDPCQGMWG